MSKFGGYKCDAHRCDYEAPGLAGWFVIGHDGNTMAHLCSPRCLHEWASDELTRANLQFKREMDRAGTR